MRNRFNTRARLMAGGAAGVLALLAVAGGVQAQTAPQVSFNLDGQAPVAPGGSAPAVAPGSTPPAQ